MWRGKIELHYQAAKSPIAIAKMAQEKEKMLGTVDVASAPLPQQLSGMPTAAEVVAPPTGLTI